MPPALPVVVYLESIGVYPRVGGETRAMIGANIPSGGLSPRGRGNRPAR